MGRLPVVDAANNASPSSGNEPTPAQYQQTLYDRYVSGFKGNLGGGSGGTESREVWWDHKYLPLLAGLERSTPILEIGCGSGDLLAYLARRGFSGGLGIDISAEQIGLAQARHPGVRVERRDALEYLGEHQAAFGAILAIDVLEHFAKSDLLNLAGLLLAALRPGGRLLIQTANGAGLFPRQVIYGDLTHETILTPQSLSQLLRTVGFANLSFYETGPIPIRLRGKLDTALWAAIKFAASAIRRIETGKRETIWTENFICLAFKPG
ncbi:MAG TPA: class I SAM-dependent methyltransferase [Chloroflexota bacterium]